MRIRALRMEARVPKTDAAYKRLLFRRFGRYVTEAWAFDVFSTRVPIAAIARRLAVGHAERLFPAELNAYRVARTGVVVARCDRAIAGLYRDITDRARWTLRAADALVADFAGTTCACN